MIDQAKFEEIVARQYRCEVLADDDSGYVNSSDPEQQLSKENFID